MLILNKANLKMSTESFKAYTTISIKFMSFLDEVEYERNTEFTSEMLIRITLTDICRWFGILTYAKQIPDENDRPIHSRSSSLHFRKKGFVLLYATKNGCLGPNSLRWEFNKV